MTHTDLLHAIGKNIKKARIEQGMIGYTLGIELGIKKAAVSQMENGLRDFKISDLFKIAAVLKTDVCSLISVQTTHSQKEFESMPNPLKSVFIESDFLGLMISRLDKLEKLVHKS